MDLFLAAALLTSIAPVQATAPNRQPQVAAVPGLTALVFGSGNSIWFAASGDYGQSFSAPTEVATVPVLALGRHRGPRAVISGTAIVVSAVYGERMAAGRHAHGLPEDGDLVAWRSSDGGRSWSKPIVINDAPGSAREGLHAMAANDRGEVAAVWLDLRAPGTRLYGAFSKDSGATWSKNVLVYESPEGTICQCCDPSVVFAGKDRVEVMFRNVVEGNRDMYISEWNLDGRILQPRKVGTGSWKINGCPMDGGGLAFRENTTFTAWRREDTVYLDRPGQPEVALGDGKDVALAVSSKGPYVAWQSPSGIELHSSDEKEPICLSPAGSFPALAVLSNGTVLVAWEQDGKIQLRSERSQSR